LSTTVIIPAAGSGQRFGEAIPKQFVKLAGIPIIIWTLRILRTLPDIQSVIIPTAKDWIEYLEKIIAEYRIQKTVHIIEGGNERQDSVMNALNVNSVTSEVILVHDSVRPFASIELFKKVIVSADEFGATVPILPPKETIKLLNGRACIEKTLDRSKLCVVQTPQGFKRDIIVTSYKKAKKEGITGTDDASIVEAAGYVVKVVEGEEMNMKITSKFDRKLAEVILSELQKKNRF
jgi:2-C-methyl-D-erythritol 4-phosphate cytidylyltransferase